MKRLVVLLAAVAACAPHLELPDELVVRCEDDADCTAGQSCAPTGFCAREIATSPLTLLAASPTDADQVVLIFDQPLVNFLAAQPERYNITPTLAVLDAYPGADAASVVLRTGEQTFGVTYTVLATDIVGASGSFIDPTAARATFIGFGIPADTSPPAPLAPADDALLVGLSQTLVWGARSGANQYSVTVATGADCSTLVSTHLVAGDLTSVEVIFPSPGRYHWCVASDLSGAERGRGVLHVVDDSVYVACPAAHDCARRDGEIGSPDAPLRSVQRAVSLAQQLGLDAVRIAGRGSGAAYDELVQITGAGVDLLGGYDEAFSTVDATAHPTMIASASVALVMSGVSTPMRIESLALRAHTTYATFAALINNSDVAALRDVVLESTGGGEAVGIAITGSKEVTLERTTVRTGQAATATGVVANDVDVLRVVASKVLVGRSTQYPLWASGIIAETGALDIASSIVIVGASEFGIQAVSATGPLTIRDSLVGAGEALVSRGVTMRDGSIERSRLYVDGVSVGSGVQTAGQGVIVRDNVVLVSGTAAETRGIELDGIALACSDGAATKVVGNTVKTTGAAIVLRAGSPVVTNNLLVAGGDCVQEIPFGPQDTVDPLSFQNNALIGCSTAYREARGAPGVATSTEVAHVDAASVHGMDGASCREEAGVVVRYSGNISGYVADSDLFTDYDGADDELFEDDDVALSETADNDLSLALDSDLVGIREGGKVGTASDCGDGGVPCGGAAVDLRGMPRTAPWSIGAYERD